MSDNGADATARVDQWLAQTREKAQRYQAMQAAVGQVSVTESSPDGMVTVTVDSAGNATDLRITDRVRELSGAQVATAVLTTLRRAQARLPERLGEVMAETIGGDQATVDTVVGRYREKFPEPPEPEPITPAPETERSLGKLEEEPPPAPPKPARRPREDNEDDGFEDRSFLR